MFNCRETNTELAYYTSRTRIERAYMLSTFMCYAVRGLMHAAAEVTAVARSAVRSLIGHIADARRLRVVLRK